MGPSDHIPPALAGEVEFFKDIEAYRDALGDAHSPSEFLKRGVVLPPDALIADGTGVHLRLDSEYSVGDIEMYRPLPGVLLLQTEFIALNAEYLSEVSKNNDPEIEEVVVRFFHSPGIRFHFGELEIDSENAVGLISFKPDKGDFYYEVIENEPINICMLNTTETGEREVWHRMGIPPSSVFKRVREGSTTEDRVFIIPRTPAWEAYAESLLHLPGSGYARASFLRLKIGELFCLLDDEDTRIASRRSGDLPFSEVRRLSEARQIIEEQFNAPPTIADLSRQVGLNRRKLTEGFKQIYGDTVGGYALEIRMRRGYQLLQDTSLSVTEVALECGYEHSNNFTIYFRRRFGCSPSQVRQLR